MVKTGEIFEVCDFAPLNRIARVLRAIELPISTLVEYIFVPLGTGMLPILVLRTFAISHSILNSVKLNNIFTEESLSDDKFYSVEHNKHAEDAYTHFKTLELLYQTLEIYLWLSIKFPKVYVDKDAAAVIKTKIANAMSKYLDLSLDTTGSIRTPEDYEHEPELWRYFIKQELLEINCVQ